MLIGFSEFLAIYDDFRAFETDVIESRLEIAEERCPASKWPSVARRKEAVMLLTAHLLECRRLQMAASASIGDAMSSGGSVSLPSLPESDLDATLYGKQFKELKRTSVAYTGMWF